MKILNLKECPEHIEQLALWHSAQWPYTSVEERIIRLNAHLTDKLPQTFVAFDGSGKLAGSASLKEYDIEDYRIYAPWLASVYVHTPFRRKGIASILCNKVAEYCFKLGHKKIFLYTPDQMNLYSRLGWTAFENRTVKQEQVTLMKRTA